MPRIRTTTMTAGAALIVALALSGCSSSQPTNAGHSGAGAGTSAAPTATSAFNDQDVTFTQMMIPHHKQAVEMADMILKKDGIDARVLKLATEIKAAQAPEIKTMNSWLDSWGASSAGMSGMDHGSGDGMMTDADMNALMAANGVDASRLFLTQMVQHHKGAVEMAQKEIDTGKSTDAIALAKSIVTSQTAEISKMNNILPAL